MKIAIIGGGVMGQAVLGAALERKVFDAADVVVGEIVEQRRLQIASEFDVETAAEAATAMSGADLVILSVKPQDVGSVSGNVEPEATLFSVMAGVRLETLAREFQHDRIIRAIPNTPVAAQAGMTVWTATPSVLPEQREFARKLLGAVGREIYVEDEAKLDMATAVRNCIHLLDLDPAEALRMASRYPAGFLQIDDCYGSIRAGYRACLVALDDQFMVRATWVDGQRENHQLV